MDNMTKRQRSYTMSRIRSSNTQQEKLLRSAIHRKGFRFRKNVSKLPGTPDIVLPKFKTVIFINGCFWHQHHGCLQAVMPKTNKQYWEGKLHKNIIRDSNNNDHLSTLGWKVITVWECELKNNLEDVVLNITNRLHNI